MIASYIRVTAGTVRWLFLGLLEFIEPVLKLIFFFMFMGGMVGLFWFSITVIGDPHDPKIKAFIVMMVAGFIGGLANVYYEIVYDRLHFTLAFGDENEDERGLLAKVVDWIGLLGIFGFFSWASYHFYHLDNELEAMFVGFCWFVAIGVMLSVGRWIYRTIGDRFENAGELASRAWSSLTVACNIISAGIKDRKKGVAATPEKTIVVPFRRRS